MKSDMDMGYQDHDVYESNTGESSAQELLENALRMKSGIDGERDMNAVLKGLEEALDSGSAEAARYLGMCYAYGDGVLQNDEYSTMYYRKGAELGDPECMYRLFRNLSTGTGCEADLDEADRWLKMAAEEGHSTAIATWDRYKQAEMLSKDLKESEKHSDAERGNRTIYIERVSPSDRLNLDKISESGGSTVVSQNWIKEVEDKSYRILLAIYIATGVVSGILLKSVYENNISIMGSLSLISNFHSVGTFMAYMAVIGGLLGLATGFVASRFLNRVHETLILYIPLLFMPLVIMCLSSMIMVIAKGVWGLILIVIQLAVYVVIGYSVFASSSN